MKFVHVLSFIEICSGGLVDDGVGTLVKFVVVIQWMTVLGHRHTTELFFLLHALQEKLDF